MGAAYAADPRADLGHFRDQILGPLTAVPVVAAIAALYVGVEADRFATWLPLVGFAAAAGIARLVRPSSADLSALCLTVGTLAALLATAYAYPSTPAACLVGLGVALAVVLLGPRSGVAAALLSAAAIGLLWAAGVGLAAEMAATAAFLTLAMAALSWLTLQPVYGALAWAWESHLQDVRTTSELRDRQGELNATVRSLNETHARLEHMNVELERARVAAQEARRVKDEFATAVSHELRTPINLIVGFSEMMMRSWERAYGVPLPAPYRADVESIYRNACHVSDLIDDILDLSQVEAHRMALRKEVVRLDAVVDDAVAAVASLLHDKRLLLDVRIAEQVPPIKADPTRVRQVLINLLANAARYTDEGGVTVSAIRRDRDVELSVADTGVGMRPEELAHVFEPFRQFGDLHRRQSGSGLGLVVSRRFVEMHGGAMWVESAPAAGTVFRFTLPVDADVVVPDETPRWERWLRARAAEAERVLIAFDPDGRATRILERYFDAYRILRASTPDDVPRLAVEHGARILVRTGLVERGGATTTPGAPTPPGFMTVDLPLRAGWAGASELSVADQLTKPVTAEQLRSAFERLGRRVRGVVVVDDDPDMVRLLARMVRSVRRGCRVWEAYEGRGAIELVRTQRPDVLLLDLLMPGMDGYAVIKAVRADPALGGTAVVVVTAKGNERDGKLSVPMITLQRDAGFSVGEAMRCLRASLDAVVPAPAASNAPVPTADRSA